MPRTKTPPTKDTPVNELWNLSRLTTGWLVDDGINTYGDLQKSDLVEVWLSLKKQHKQVTRLMYYALWGAVNDCHWNNMPQEEKEKLSKS